MQKLRIRLALLALVALLAPGAELEAAGPEPAEAPTSVLLLVLDSLRPSHLGCYGYPRPTTPNLDAFAAEAVLFENAYATSSWTAPGVASTLLGSYPAVHGMDARDKFPDPYLPTPLKELAADGWMLRGYLARGEVFGNLGFAGNDLAGQRLHRVLGWVEEPYFVWYQLKEAHLPYRASKETAELFARPDSPPLGEEQLRLLTQEPMIPAGTTDWDPATRPALEDLYDGAVRQQDEAVGEILRRLRELGRWERTIVVITADHGEELLEHGQVGHASTTQAGTVFDELIRIPLLIRVPGMAGGRVVDEVASQVDVMPTLFDLLGRSPRVPMQGRSLVGAMTGEPGSREGDRPVFVETTECGWQCLTDRAKTVRLKGVRTARWKLVVRADELGNRGAKLYDLGADPNETRDAAAANPGVVERLSAVLSEHERANLDLARRIVLETLERRRESLAAAPPARRRALAAESCDELAGLRSVYRIENPSLFDDPAAAAEVGAAMSQILGLLGPASGYWRCRELAALVPAAVGD